MSDLCMCHFYAVATVLAKFIQKTDVLQLQSQLHTIRGVPKKKAALCHFQN